MFLQSYQLILWEQCRSLILEKGFPADLEDVIRDIWTLQLQFVLTEHDHFSDDENDSHLYSSQTECPDPDEEGSNGEGRWKARAVLPRLIDTLGMCYIGMMLLRLSVSLGDLFRYEEYAAQPVKRY